MLSPLWLGVYSIGFFHKCIGVGAAWSGELFSDDYDKLSKLARQQSPVLGKSWPEKGVASDEVYVDTLRRQRETGEAAGEVSGAAGRDCPARYGGFMDLSTLERSRAAGLMWPRPLRFRGRAARGLRAVRSRVGMTRGGSLVEEIATVGLRLVSILCGLVPFMCANSAGICLAYM